VATSLATSGEPIRQPEHDLCRQADAGSHPDMRHWWATTEMMNPTISPAFLESERSKDPNSYRREYEARFDSGVGAVFDEATVRTAIAKWTRPRLHHASYVLAIDAAFVADTFAAAVGRRDGERVVVDRIVGWRGLEITRSTTARLSMRSPLLRTNTTARELYSTSSQPLNTSRLPPTRGPWIGSSPKCSHTCAGARPSNRRHPP
jgi:hypothetical protein